MLESANTLADLGISYSRHNLAPYRYHTGAALTALKDDEVCPILFRDLGLVATKHFLQGTLSRLAGPQTPLLYMRTYAYSEPYFDYGQIGRIVFLRPRLLDPWHSGIDPIYVARSTVLVESEHVAYVPSGFSLKQIAHETEHLKNKYEFREYLSNGLYDDMCSDANERISRLLSDLEQTERVAARLRSCLQRGRTSVREEARAILASQNLTESDLCTAWHHLPKERRDFVKEVCLNPLVEESLHLWESR